MKKHNFVYLISVPKNFELFPRLNIQVELLGQVERLLGSYIRHVLEKRLKSAEFMGLVS